MAALLFLINCCRQPLRPAVLLQGSEDWGTPHLGNHRPRFIMLDVEEDAGKEGLVKVPPALRLAQLVGAAAAAHQVEDGMQGGLSLS